MVPPQFQQNIAQPRAHPSHLFAHRGAAFPADPEGQLDTITPRLIYCVINALGLAFACYRLNGMGLFPTHLTDWAGTIEAPRVPEVGTQGLW